MFKNVVWVVLAMAVVACGDRSIQQRAQIYEWKLENVPPSARQVARDTYVLSLSSSKTSGAPIEGLPDFGYAETINPKGGLQAVTSLELGTFRSLSPALRNTFSGARLGEIRHVWTCPPRARMNCKLTEYVFYATPR